MWKCNVLFNLDKQIPSLLAFIVYRYMGSTLTRANYLLLTLTCFHAERLSAHLTQYVYVALEEIYFLC